MQGLQPGALGISLFFIFPSSCNARDGRNEVQDLSGRLWFLQYYC